MSLLGENPSFGGEIYVSQKDKIFDLDDTIKGVYYIKSGSIEINLFTIHGPEKALFIVGHGCVFGEVSCFMEETGEEASGRARTDCELYYFKKEIIEDQIASQYLIHLSNWFGSLAYKIPDVYIIAERRV